MSVRALFVHGVQTRMSVSFNATRSVECHVRDKRVQITGVRQVLGLSSASKYRRAPHLHEQMERVFI